MWNGVQCHIFAVQKITEHFLCDSSMFVFEFDLDLLLGLKSIVVLCSVWQGCLLDVKTACFNARSKIAEWVSNLVMSFVLSYRKEQLSLRLGAFSWSFIRESLSKICLEYSSLVIIGQNDRHVSWRPTYSLLWLPPLPWLPTTAINRATKLSSCQLRDT